MTYEEAIEYIECGAVAHCCCASNKKHGGDCDGEKAVNEALAIAIKALEKQIQKKPIKRVVDRGFNLPIPTNVLVCPVCGVDTPIPRDLESWEFWCPDCGQAIDWSEEDE